MPCCVCASGCKVSTTNLRKHEEPEHETEMDLPGSAGDAAIYRRGRCHRAAPVEFATAGAVRMARDYFLAGARDSGAVPSPFRRTWRSGFLSLQFPPPLGRALGVNDA